MEVAKIIYIAIFVFTLSKLLLKIHISTKKAVEDRKDRLSLLNIQTLLNIIIFLLCIIETLTLINIGNHILGLIIITALIGFLELVALLKNILCLSLVRQLNNYLDNNEDELNKLIDYEKKISKDKDKNN